MFRAIAYKEWLKIRWVWLILLVLSLAVAARMLLSLQQALAFRSPIVIWTLTVFQGYQYYGSLRYLPLAIGLAIGAAQFIPEVLSRRLTLSLHLPLRENRAILWMLAVGFLAASALVVATAALVVAIGFWYFPREIVVSALLNMAPWILAGCAGYFGLAALLVEPRWLQKALLLLMTAGFIDLLMEHVNNRAYTPLLPVLLVLAAGLSLAIVLSVRRFRRGVQ